MTVNHQHPLHLLVKNMPYLHTCMTPHKTLTCNEGILKLLNLSKRVNGMLQLYVELCLKCRITCI